MQEDVRPEVVVGEAVAAAGIPERGTAVAVVAVLVLATSRLEAMNLLVDQELQSLPDSIKEGKFAPPLDGYAWKATSTPVSDQAGLYSVHVTVEWTNGSYELKTYMYRSPRLVTRR